MRGEGVELAETEGFGPRVGERMCLRKGAQRCDAARASSELADPTGSSRELSKCVEI